MSDIDLLFQAANTFIKKIVNDLFGISTIGTDTLITYILNNAKDKYSVYLDILTDKNGNINIDILDKALTDTVKTRGNIKIFGNYIKFTEKDVSDFINMFKQLKCS